MDPTLDPFASLPMLRPVPGADTQRIKDRVAATPRSLGMLEGGTRQLAQGIPVVGSWTDEIGGNLAGSAPGQIQAENDAFTKAHPVATAVARTLGGIGSMLGLAAAPEAALGPVAGLRGAAFGAKGLGPLLGVGTVGGAIEGAGMSDGGDFVDRARGAGIGAAGGLATSAFAPMVGGAVHNVTQGIARAAARSKANKALPGAAAVGDITGPLPRPNFNKAPETMVGDLSPKATGLAGEIATRGDTASDKVVSAYAARNARNQPIGKNTAPPSPAQEGYAKTNQSINDAVQNYSPTPRPGVIETARNALPGALGIYGGLAAAGSGIGQSIGGHIAGGSAAIAKIIQAVLSRPKETLSPGLKMGAKDAGGAAGVLSMAGKLGIDPTTGKTVNPEISSAVDEINKYLMARRGADNFAKSLKGIGIGTTMGAGAGLEPQGADLGRSISPGAKTVYDKIRGRKN